MINFWKKVVKYRVLILIGSVLLLIPATLGYLHTRVNYDVLTYLPDDIETMQGQDILVNDFNTGAFSMFIVDGIYIKESKSWVDVNKEFYTDYYRDINSYEALLREVEVL